MTTEKEMKFETRADPAKIGGGALGQGDVYAVTPWPKRIAIYPNRPALPFYWSKDNARLEIQCKNGSAIYYEEGSDATVWRGVLQIARGDHPVAAL